LSRVEVSGLRFPSKGERADHRKFYETKGIVGWREELALRSELTASDYVRRLALFSWSTGWSPGKIVTVAKAKDGEAKLRAFLTEYAAGMVATGKRPVYIRKHFDAIRSWLDRNGIHDFRGIPEVSARRGETLDNEQTPTPIELRRLLGALDLRGRVSALLMAHSGLRPGAISAGSDGLRLSDLPELDLGTLSFGKVPFVISVRAARSKNAKRYVTFGSPELAEALVSSLRDRIAKGETLRPESPVLAATGKGVGKEAGEFITTKALVLPIRRAIKTVRPGGRTFRPYALRAFFSTQLLIAETRGACVRDGREELMGHDLGVSGRYNLAKKLNAETLEELRGMYERSLPFLTDSGASPATSNEEVFRLILTEFFNYDPADLAKAGPLTPDRVRELADLRRKSEAESQVGAAPGSQRVVEISAVESYIAKGWKFIAPLNGSKAILEAPS
jgi:integrase